MTINKKPKPRRAGDGHYRLGMVDPATGKRVGDPISLWRRELETGIWTDVRSTLGESICLPGSELDRQLRDAVISNVTRFFDGQPGRLLRLGLDKAVDDRHHQRADAVTEDEDRTIAALFDSLYDQELRLAPNRRPKLDSLYADVKARHVPTRGITTIKDAVSLYSQRHRPKKPG